MHVGIYITSTVQNMVKPVENVEQDLIKLVQFTQDREHYKHMLINELQREAVSLWTCHVLVIC